MRRVRQVSLNREWFDLGKNGGSRVTVFLGEMKLGKLITKVFIRNDCGVELYFLQAEKVWRYLLDKLIEGLFSAGPQAIYVPGDKGLIGILCGHE